MRRRLSPRDRFALIALVFGLLLLVFPILRVPGLAALVAAAAYWLATSVIIFVRRRDR